MINKNKLNDLRKIIYRNSDILRNNKTRLSNFLQPYNKILYGGGNRVLSIKYDNNKYEFLECHDDNYFILYSKNEEDCVTVIINDKIAEIHGIGNYETCSVDTNVNVGSILLKITIKMLQKYRDKFNINKIILTDNSIKKCGNKNIILSTMLILLTGNNWYGKYGFRPYDNINDKLNKRLNIKYENNQNIMSSITITEANIIKYIELTKKERIIEDVKKLINLHPNMLLTDFLNQFLKDYDKTCKYFELFYEDLFDDLGLTTFYKQSFVLFI